MLIGYQDIDMKWQVKAHSVAQRIYKYAVHIPGPQNTESDEPELKNTREKPKIIMISFFITP